MLTTTAMCYLCSIASFWSPAAGRRKSQDSILCSNGWTGGTAEAHVSAIPEHIEDCWPERRPELQSAAAWLDTKVRRSSYDSTDYAELIDRMWRHLAESVHTADIRWMPSHEQEPPVQRHHGTLYWWEVSSWADVKRLSSVASGFQFDCSLGAFISLLLCCNSLWFYQCC